MDKYERLVAIRIANQLRRKVDPKLSERILWLAENHSTEEGFVEACKDIAKFDPTFLSGLYREKRERLNVTSGQQQRVVKKEDEQEEKLEQKTKGMAKLAPNTVSGHKKPMIKDEEDTEDGPRIKVKHENGLSIKAQQKLAEIRRKREGKMESSSKNNTAKNKSGSSLDSDDRKEPITMKRKFHETSPNTKPQSHQQQSPRRRWRSGNTENFEKGITPEPQGIQEMEEHEAEIRDALDRDWYDMDEIGHAAGDEVHNPFYDQFSYNPDIEREMEEKMQKKMSLRARQRQKDADAWERNRMQKSGVAHQNEIDLDADSLGDGQSRVHLFVHNLKPPFLDGKQIFTRQKDPITAVRDPESNMAQYSKRGSQLVKERRQFRERQKQARQMASMAGTTLGNVLGVKEEEEASDDEEAKRLERALDREKDTQQSTPLVKLSMREQRQQLPAFAVRDELMSSIRENQVTIVIGETGSGKTTQLTQFLYEAGYAERGIIGCTQPRRVAAMSVAKRVSEEMGVKVGEEVGYSIRFEDITSPNTKIKYLTDGILLREALMEGDLEKYSCIIMDEAHERALNTDILLGVFKQILFRRRDLKLIVTSATMNAERFSNFFGSAPQFTIPGRTYPVSINYLDSTPVDYVEAAVRQVLQIHVGSGPGDILVFMTGQEDIETTCEVIEDRVKLLDKPSPLLILPIYSQMPADLQSKIFDPAPKGTRKVVVATNIAETSLTVDGISYVVDAGYTKVKVFNPKLNMDSLQVVPISQANAGQRSGRAGRTSKGTAYRLYTEGAQLEEMYKQTVPEIQRSNLANTILILKNLGVGDLLEFDFIDPPPTDTMTASLYDLWALGALDNVGNLTEEGKRMASFPMEPSMAKLLVKSIEYGCSEEMITIVSMLSVSAVFYRPRERTDEADSAREKFFVAESDHLTLLHVYNQWIANKRSEAWCTRHYLFSRQLHRAYEIREQLASIFNKQNIHLTSSHGDWDIIRKCICSGFFHQAARVKGSDGYANLRTGVVSKLHYTSSLTGLGFLPEFVVYHELVLTSTQYVSNVTAVDPEWLAELGAVFYSVREKSGTAALGSTSYSDKRAIEHEHGTRMQLEAQIERDRVRYEKSKMRDSDKDERSKRSKKSAVVMPGGKSRTKRRGI